VMPSLSAGLDIRSQLNSTGVAGVVTRLIIGRSSGGVVSVTVNVNAAPDCICKQADT
jgi:hypothetical protein